MPEARIGWVYDTHFFCLNALRRRSPLLVVYDPRFAHLMPQPDELEENHVAILFPCA